MYKKDSNIVSILWGRIGAAILLLAAVVLEGFGYTFGAEDQAAVYDAISTVLASGALVQVTVSKIRENKKVKKL